MINQFMTIGQAIEENPASKELFENIGVTEENYEQIIGEYAMMNEVDLDILISRIATLTVESEPNMDDIEALDEEEPVSLDSYDDEDEFSDADRDDDDDLDGFTLS